MTEENQLLGLIYSYILSVNDFHLVFESSTPIFIAFQMLYLCDFNLNTSSTAIHLILTFSPICFIAKCPFILNYMNFISLAYLQLVLNLNDTLLKSTTDVLSNSHWLVTMIYQAYLLDRAETDRGFKKNGPEVVLSTTWTYLVILF